MRYMVRKPTEASSSRPVASVPMHNYAEKVAARLILIDGPTLASLLVEHNIGAQNSETFVLKRVDEDFFEEV